MQLTREQFLKAAGPVAIVCALCAGGGATYQAHADLEVATKLAADTAIEHQHERDAATDRETHLAALIDTERKEHAKDAQESHHRQLGFARNAGRVRSGLETLLADARRSTQDCTARTDAIAESVGELVDLAGEGDELLRAATAENAGLRAENQRLAKQVFGLQQFAKGPDRITVTSHR